MRRFWIELDGHGGHEVLALTASKARAMTYRAWCDAGYDDAARRNGIRPFTYFLGRIVTFHALGEAPDLDPRTPEYGVAP